MLVLLGLVGCLISEQDVIDAMDRDNDGYASVAFEGGDDCDDDDSSINPGAFESCLDDIDSDCDGSLCPPQALVDMGAVEPLLWGAAGDWVSARQAAADFNGDGTLDLVLSAPAASAGAGRVYFLPGPVSELSGIGDAVLVIDGNERDSLQVRGVGDIDGDGIDEVYLSAMSPEDSQVYIVDETSTADDPFAVTISTPANGFKKPGDEGELEEFSLFGGALQLDADTLLVMAPLDHGSGRAYLLDAPIEDIDLGVEEARATFSGDNYLDFFGGGTHSTPDFNGDGQADVLLSSPGFDLIDKDGDLLFYEIGSVSGFLGDTVGDVVSADADLLIYGSFAEAHIEWAADLGDLNGDGYDDVGVFAHTGPGDFAVFYGPLEGLNLTSDADFKLFGDGSETDTEDFGFESIGLDANSDGYGDLLIPAPAEGIFLSDVPGGGASYLFLGPITGVLGPDHADACWRGGIAEGALGSPQVADFDGDKKPDLLMSAPGASRSGEDHEGAVYLLSDAFGGL